MSPAQTRSVRIEEGAAAPRAGVAVAVPAFVAVAGVILAWTTTDVGGGPLTSGNGFELVTAAGVGAAVLALAVAVFLPGRRTAATGAPAAPSAGEQASTAPTPVEPALNQPTPSGPHPEQPGAGTAGEGASGAAVAVPLARAVAELVATVPGLTDGGPAGGGRAVRGRVRGAEGIPVGGAAVTLISLGGRQVGRAVAALDGSYELLTPGEGAYVLIASADGHQPQAATVVVGAAPVTHDVLLSAASGLTGAVRSTADGAPVAEAVVVVMDVRGDVLATARTDGKGEFTVADLVPGAVVLAVSSPEHRPLAQSVEIGAAGVTRVDLGLRTGAQVRGTVRGAGVPLRDARVTLVDAAGNVVATATTGGDGAYAFTDLDDGPYTVVAAGYPPRADQISVGGADEGDHDIELAHAGDRGLSAVAIPDAGSRG
ncbi:carboxypeptidase-like regulatory domain-containing protein [Streptomyces sp. NBC_00199]|uniref:MSCRAMM family protein n=1 Tax=Streptomyces sp. NBC_00199 TaxID=2975678 RepID=UPI002B1D00C5|nr:carboxypeptidase-like regulatory domain-containing protein [Streptomyces sp. NBC_00199]